MFSKAARVRVRKFHRWAGIIIGIQLVGFLSLGVVTPSTVITQFQVSVTYLMVASLTLTGLLQLAFTRYIADGTAVLKDDVTQGL